MSAEVREALRVLFKKEDHSFFKIAFKTWTQFHEPQDSVRQACVGLQGVSPVLAWPTPVRLVLGRCPRLLHVLLRA